MNMCYHLLSIICKSTLLGTVRHWMVSPELGQEPGLMSWEIRSSFSLCRDSLGGQGTATLKRMGLRFC